MDKLNPYAIVVRPEITTPAQLRGGTLAILRPGDTTDISARIALTPLGINVGQDVTPIDVGNSPARLTALLSGQVDGALLSEAFIDQARQNGMNVLVSLRDQKIPYVAASFITPRSFALSNPNTVLAFLKGISEGTKFFSDAANKDASVAIIAKYMKLQPSDPTVQNAYDFYHDSLAHDVYPDADGVDTVLSALRQITPGTYDAITTDQVVDASFTSRLRQEGFVDTVWGP